MKSNLLLKKIIMFLVLFLSSWMQIQIQANPHTQDKKEVKALAMTLDQLSVKYDVIFSYEWESIKHVTIDADVDDFKSLDESIKKITSETDLNIDRMAEKIFVVYKRKSQRKKIFKKLTREVDTKKVEPSDASSTMRSEIRTVKPLELLTPPLVGRIVDENGEPLIGVNVLVKGTSQGASTDFDGNFSLTNVADDAVLVVTYIGYQSQEVSVDGQNQIEIVLLPDSKTLDEVVVVGYGTQKKENLTGSVASISSDKLENRPLPNVGEVLRGVSPNLNIDLSGFGGEPGASRSWNIRGIGSINGNDSPLILVDGVEMDINNLDPNNIKSVSVLKDASAAAIYGSRAPFGVVLITTKTGKKGEPVKIQYSNNIAFGSMLGVSHMENSLTYATVFNQASTNAGSPPLYNEEYLGRIEGYLNGTYTTEYDPDNPPNSIWAGRRVGNASYDWPYELMKNFKVDQKHNISIGGGGEKTQYYISMGFYDENGFYSVGYDDYKRYDVLANFKAELTNWLDFDFSTKYAATHTDYPLGITTVERRYFFTNLYYFSPLTPKYNINGSIANPMYRSIEDSGRDVTDRNNMLITAKTIIEPIEGWTTQLSFNYNLAESNNTVNPKPIPVELATGGFGNVGKPGAAYETSFSRSPYTLINLISSYEKNLGNHFFKILGGYEQEEKRYTYLYARGDDLITTEIPSLSTALGVTTLDDTKWEWVTQGMFGRLNYNFDQKYLLEVSARYNGSSRFAPDSRWGFFPSASLGYVISKENFWLPLSEVVNRAKLRASYGSLGNQNVSNYLYIASIPVSNETPWIIGNTRPSYARTPGIISPDLTWETITTLNIGIDLGFLEDKLEFNFDWYNRQTSDMFGPQQTLPYTLGTSTPRVNNAKLETRGFEAIVNWRDDINNDFSYNVQLSFGDNKSKILEYVNEEGLINTWYSGKDIGEIWGFETVGIIQTEAQAESMADQSAIYPNWGPGDIQYRDLNGDGKITYGAGTLDDHGDRKIIGNSSPRYNIAIGSGFDWKGFNFSMQWMGIGKMDYFPHRNNVTFWGLTHSWGSSAVLKGAPTLDYWRPADETNSLGPNTDAYLPKPYFSNETNKNRNVVQSKYLLNAAYLRLKFVQLGYQIPSQFTQKFFVQNARVYVSGTNLITFKSLPQGIDPEQTIGAGYTTSGAFYPLSKSISVGLNVTF